MRKTHAEKQRDLAGTFPALIEHPGGDVNAGRLSSPGGFGLRRGRAPACAAGAPEAKKRLTGRFLCDREGI